MLYAAHKADREVRYGAKAVVLRVTRAAGSAFAPSAGLFAGSAAGRLGWRQVERRHTEEMRALYRADPRLWFDPVEQAALDAGDVVLVCGECGPERPEAGEALAHCHRRLLKGLLVAVAADRGLMVDPDADDLQVALLQARRTAVLAAEGVPLTCPVCGRPAVTARAIARRGGYGHCSPACLDSAGAEGTGQAAAAASRAR
jgi:hypothetical protein